MAIQRRKTVVPAPVVLQSTQKFEGNDGSWSTFFVEVGTPPQTFRVLISTGGSETWVVVPEGCTSSDPSDCASARGAETFNGQASEGFATNSSSTWSEIGLYSLDLETSLGRTGNGLYGYDVVGINGGNSSGGISLSGQVVAGIADKDFFLGMIGLSDRPDEFSSSSKPITSLLTNLFENNLIPSLSYGYTAGAQYRNKGVLGDCVLGGFDQSKFTPTSFSFSFASADARQLEVGVQSITASNTLLGVNSFTSSGGFLALVDSAVPEIWVPSDVADKFEAAFGLTYDDSTGYYLVNDTIHSKLQSLKPQLTFSLGNTAFENGNNSNIILPYAAFDQKIGYPIYNSSRNYFPIRKAANDSQLTIGRAFLQEAYLVVDHSRKNFTIGQAIFTDPQPSARIVSIRHPDADSGSKPKTGLIAGIVIALMLVLVAGGVVAFLLLRRRKQKNSKHRKIRDANTPELDNANNTLELDGTAVYPHNHKELNGSSVELSEVPGDTFIAELHAPRDARKSMAGSTFSELPAEPVHVYEMAGDHAYNNNRHHDPRSTVSSASNPFATTSHTSTGITRRPSPFATPPDSPLSPQGHPSNVTSPTESAFTSRNPRSPR